MAEFGVFASAIQLVEVGVRTALSMNYLASRVRHAPKVIRDAQQQVEAVNRISQSIEASWTAQRHLHSASAPDLKQYLDDCSEPIKELRKILAPLEQNMSDGKWRKALQIVLTVKKEDEIIEVVKRIETAKSSLDIFLCKENFFALQVSNRSLQEVEHGLQSLSPLSQDIPIIAQRVQNIQDVGGQVYERIPQLQDNLATIQSDVSFSRNDVQKVAQKVENLQHQVKNLESSVHRQQDLTSGTAVAQVQDGTLQIDAMLKRTDGKEIEAVLHNLLDGVVNDYQQNLVARSRRDIRGWLNEHIQTSISSTADEILSELKHSIFERERQLKGHLSPLSESSGRSSNHSTRNEETGSQYQLQQWDIHTSNSSAKKRSIDAETFLSISSKTRRTILGLFVLRVVRGIKWQKINLIFQPIRFVSSGLELSYSYCFDGRGLPIIRGGELHIYGIIPYRDPIWNPIFEDDLEGLHDALRSKAISIFDRDPNSRTLLHVAVKWGTSRIVKELVDSGANVQATDRFGLRALDLVLLRLSMNLFDDDKLLPMLEVLLQYQSFDDLYLSFGWAVAYTKRDQSDSTRMQSGLSTRQLQWFQRLRNKGLDLFREENVNQLRNNEFSPPSSHGYPALLDILENWTFVAFLECNLRVFFDYQLSWLLNLLISGANPCICDHRGFNALHSVVMTVHYWYCNYTLAWDYQVIHWITEWLSESTTILLCYGCDPNAQNTYGRLPLDFASYYGYEQIILSSRWYANRLLRPSLWQATSDMSTNNPNPPPREEKSTRKRRKFMYVDDWQEHEANTECTLSGQKIMPYNPDIVNFTFCGDSCPLQWPIAWRLWVHRDCPRSCSDEILSTHEPSPHEKFLREHLPKSGKVELSELT